MKSTRASWLISILAMALAAPLCAVAQISLSVSIAPPPLVVYEQPPIPAPDYIWTPGYWSYGPDGYFWVPGTWVEPPEPGFLWTPGYWAWSDGLFVWTAGYWAPQIGFYGGVNYGYGYPGRGYEGGYWRDDHFYYNRAVNNISNVRIENVYNKTVVNNITTVKTSYVGGPGGITARPTPEEQAVMRANHVAPTPQQMQHHSAAAGRPELREALNHGRPPIAATSKPGELVSRSGAPAETSQGGRSAETSRGGAPAEPRAPAPQGPVHARDLPRPPPAEPPAPGASEAQRTAAQQQQQLQERQAHERESLAQQQERDHARLPAGPSASHSEAFATMERQHQQQTQQLQQRHATEREEAHASPPPRPRPEPERKSPGH